MKFGADMALVAPLGGHGSRTLTPSILVRIQVPQPMISMIYVRSERSQHRRATARPPDEAAICALWDRQSCRPRQDSEVSAFVRLQRLWPNQ